MRRHCDRPGCCDPASATLGYDQRTQTVWLDDVAGEDHPATYDLCRRHADALSVPLGWHLRDRRRGVQAQLHVIAG
jgi:hypothetical protein